ncbi:RNase E specificity factor CsrD [Chimaeribacter californicus]|uniref:RNase E specificity factor CsrD n=1 Tax=Chimaeribacter californicus TaxID=2060067 RepID=A0A2N5DXY5_9GAMM|nr:RNase E specificity factor CsrD [Chimaeribacter californicus]PLR32365.1 RNase E specificity factor CsrD [Chimaeribacter californicus]
MRFTTKLSAFITLLVALAMLLMLLGCAFSFFNLSHQRMHDRLTTLATTFDQALLSQPPGTVRNWLPLAMRTVGVSEVNVVNGHNLFYHLALPPDSTRPPLASEYRDIRLPLLQHPGSFIHLTYLDPIAGYTHSLRSSLPISLAILAMIGVMGLSYRWLTRQIAGYERLETRARQILRGERDSVMQGDIHEWPPTASSALDRLLRELREAQEERGRVDTLIRTFAAQDAGTGLNNRLFFDNQLTTQLEDAGAYGVVMLIRLPDVDTLRDIHGRPAVQDLLNAVANLLSTFVMRYPAALLARYFASDFAVLLPHSTLKEADVIAGQLVNAVGALPTHPIGREALLSIGISTYRFGQTPEQVMDNAEQAARLASLQGSNGWVVHDSRVPERGRGSVRWRTLLEHTLARDGLRLYQKPSLTRDGQRHHIEILRRIFDGEQELPAAEFIPFAMLFGLAQRYDRQTLTQILPLLAAWPEEILAFPLTVDALLQRPFQQWLRDTLLQCEKSQRRRIMIELAEADLCQHIDRLRPVLRLLHGLGCRLVVAQAGLTVVSTTYIKSLPVELVKLHPGLVRSIDRRVENQLFVQSLVNACDGTQVQVFASGVRTAEEWQTLKEKGVQGGQGDYFALPALVERSNKKYSHN